MWPKFMFLAVVFLCYTGYSYAKKGNRPVFGKCKEPQNFDFCADFGTMADSGQVYSYNARKGKCELVFQMCSTADFNVFSSMRRCKTFCGKGKKGCNVRGRWYKHKEWISTEGCCMCLNGLMSCAACTESNGFCEACSRFNRPVEERRFCRYGEECEDDDDDDDEDCRCKTKEEYCREECKECEDDEDCPSECDCDVVQLFEQLGLGPVIH